MNNHSISVDKNTFKSPLIIISALFFSIAAILSILSVVYLFHPNSISAIRKDILANQIYDPDAQKTWLVIYIVLTVLNCICTLVLSIGLLLILLKAQHLGTLLISNSINCAIYALNISGIGLLVLFIFKSIKYIIQCFQDINEGIFPLFAFILMEGFMFTLVCLLFFKLRHFLECCMESITSISYMLYTSKITAPSLPPSSIYGFLILTFVNAYLVFDRLFSFAYTNVRNEIIYYLPMSKEPIHIFSGLSFGFASIGCILLYFYLRGYKKKSELLLYRSIKNIEE